MKCALPLILSFAFAHVQGSTKLTEVSYKTDGKVKGKLYSEGTSGTTAVPAYSETFYQLKSALLPTPNGAVDALNVAYYGTRYLTSLFHILAECFFFEGTSCV